MNSSRVITFALYLSVIVTGLAVWFMLANFSTLNEPQPLLIAVLVMVVDYFIVRMVIRRMP